AKFPGSLFLCLHKSRFRIRELPVFQFNSLLFSANLLFPQVNRLYPFSGAFGEPYLPDHRKHLYSAI
ncbi:MAG TPA: hypothetical protein VMC08_02370, partial [Bacteroidales bacterium]|nr:hypothetical protein [Bacteroidales bacterium]